MPLWQNKLYFGFSFSSIIQMSEDYSLKYLLTLLNSSFAQKWFYTFGKQRGVGVDIGVEKLRLFPVKTANADSVPGPNRRMRAVNSRTQKRLGVSSVLKQRVHPKLIKAKRAESCGWSRSSRTGIVDA